MSWQNHRVMAPEELAQAIKATGMKPAAAARYLGMSARQMRRHLRGEREIPVPVVLLLNCLIAHRLKPLVPRPKARSY
jgi:DNA-binding transcriptional regulator YiaG